MNCPNPQCDNAELKEERGNYQYVQSGLDSVTLLDIILYRCPKCDQIAPSIPTVLRAHDQIAAALMTKLAPLTPAEFKFLEKELKYKKVNQEVAPLKIAVCFTQDSGKCVVVE